MDFWSLTLKPIYNLLIIKLSKVPQLKKTSSTSFLNMRALILFKTYLLFVHNTLFSGVLT